MIPTAYPIPREPHGAGRIDEGAIAGRMMRALVLVVIVVFVSEYVIMKGLGLADTLGNETKALVDAFFSSTVLLPVLLLVFVRPVVRAARGWASAERALSEAHEALEARVEERTTELAEANQALRREMEERRAANLKIWSQAMLLDAVQQAVVAVDCEGRVTYANRFAAELFRWDPGVATGRRLEELGAFGTAPVGVACGEQPAQPAETDVRLPDGTGFPALLTVSGISGPEGEPLGLVYAATEISALKRVEEELRYSEAKYSTLVRHSPTGIFICRGGLVLYANGSFQEITGVPERRIGEVEFAEVVHPEDRRLAVPEGGLSADPGSREFRIVRPDGEVRWVTGRWAAVPYQGGESLLGNVQDITERKSAERGLQESREALRRLSHSLLTAQEDERKRVARDLHDSIGQSLSFLYLMLDDLVGPPWPEERRAQVITLKALLPRVQEAIGEVRRIFMALRPPILDDLGLLAAADWFLQRFQAASPAVEVEQAFNVEEGAIPEELKIVIYRILQEAVNNTAKHSHAKRLDVALEIEEGALRLLVMDDGVGFDPKVGKEGGAEHGLGLTSMRERVELSGGSLQVRTAPGKGTTIEAAWRLGTAEVSG